MTLTLIRKVEKDELLENTNYKHNDYLKDIYGDIDGGRLSFDDKETFQTFVNNILNDNNSIVNEYYTYEVDIEEKLYPKLRDLSYEYSDISALNKLLDPYWQPSNDKIQNVLYSYLRSKEVKGIRENTPLLKLISLYLKSNSWENDSISRILEKLKYQINKKYIINISNTGYSQLTSSYTRNYSSCYELSCGGYRASNVYLMGDARNYVVKVFKYNDDNLSRIEDDTLKVSRDVISRFNMYCETIDDKQYVLVNKIYGSYEYVTSNDYRELIYDLLKNSIPQYSNIELFDDDRCFNRSGSIYVGDFQGYEDYECNVTYRNLEDRENYSRLRIGNSNHINWEIYDSEMIMVYGQVYTCECCGYETDCEGDLYYCEDTEDHRCSDCCWWCDYDSCYYSYNTRYVETPDGRTFREEDCYIS